MCRGRGESSGNIKDSELTWSWPSKTYLKVLPYRQLALSPPIIQPWPPEWWFHAWIYTPSLRGSGVLKTNHFSPCVLECSSTDHIIMRPVLDWGWLKKQMWALNLRSTYSASCGARITSMEYHTQLGFWLYELGEGIFLNRALPQSPH